MNAAVWAVVAAAHAGVAAWALWANLARDLHDRAPLGLYAYPAEATWASARLGWAVFAAEAAGAAVAAAAAAATLAWPGLQRRALYVFFWLAHVATTTTLASAFLAWTGLVDVSVLAAVATATTAAPAVLAAGAELMWAAEAARARGRVGWTETPASRAAWAAAGGALALAALATFAFLMRAAAASAVRGDAPAYAWAAAALLAAAGGVPVAWAAARHACDDYFTAASNQLHGAVRTAATAALRIAAAVVLLVAFLRGV